MSKKLLRISKNRWAFGVCGGFANYFNADPSLIRIIWIIATFASGGTGILVYLICAIILPKS